MKKIIHFARIHAAPNAVYQGLTTETGLSGWWSTAVHVEPGEHGQISFRFAGDFNPVMQVMHLAADRRVEWQCVAGHDNWKDNKFSFELREERGETDLMFIQEYARAQR